VTEINMLGTKPYSEWIREM